MDIGARFVAIDVETANPDYSSICQIGLAVFENGGLLKSWSSYVNPEDWFYPVYVAKHGIDEDTVKDAPLITDIVKILYDFLDGHIAVCHTAFDRVAIRQAMDKYEQRLPQCEWLDSARVARRTWKQFAQRGYALDNICGMLGHDFKHHDALEDAKAAGHVLLSAMALLNLDVEGCMRRVNQPINPRASTGGSRVAKQGNPDGSLYGEIMVFTGALQIPRRQAADMAANIGCEVAVGVNRKTTILVVGDQDIKKLAGHKKSRKQRKAEELISGGQQIRIIGETDFKMLCELNPPSQ